MRLYKRVIRPIFASEVRDAQRFNLSIRSKTSNILISYENQTIQYPAYAQPSDEGMKKPIQHLKNQLKKLVAQKLTARGEFFLSISFDRIIVLNIHLHMLLTSSHSLPHPPKRIVSLVPSQTALLHTLGLETETIGITKFCIHPETWRKTKTIVGGTKNIQLEKVMALQPDLIIANKEENTREQVEALATHFPVWVTDVNNLTDAYRMMEDIGNLTHKTESANHCIQSISKAFEALQMDLPKIPACYIIWKDPYMTVGGDTFISDMMEKAGWQNVCSHLSRYPCIEVEQIRESRCEWVLLSSEPYPFKEKHIQALSAQLPECKIRLVDGEMFSWYGSHLLQAPSYFQKLIAERK